MDERFDYQAMIPPVPLIYEGRFIVTRLRCPRHICYATDSWEEIVADEAKYGIDANRARLICTGRRYDPADDESTRKRIIEAAKAQEREEKAFLC